MKNLSIGKKLVIGFIAATFIPVTVLSYFAYNNAKEALIHETSDFLTAIREEKSIQVLNLYQNLGQQLKSMSSSETTRRALKEFSQGFDEMSKEMNPDFIETAKKSVWGYWENSFGKKFSELNTGENPEGLKEKFEKLSNQEILLQYLYISSNSNPLGSKDALEKATDNSKWTKSHTNFHPDYRKLLQEFGLYDIFLINKETRNVVYSVFKELDFATSLSNGPWSSSGLAAAASEIFADPKPDSVKLVDFKPYYPSYNGPASFIGSPIIENGEVMGALIFQVPISNINKILTSDKKWESVGMGKTGDAFLVGQDGYMRSDSRGLIEHPDNYKNLLVDAGISDKEASNIMAKGSTILAEKRDSDAIRKALNGEKYIGESTDNFNKSVLTSSGPVEIFGIKSALVSQLDTSEAFEAVENFKYAILYNVLGGMIFSIGLAIYFARYLTKPIIQIMASLTRGSAQVASSSNQVASTGQSLAQGSTEQAASLEETAAALEEVASMTKHNAENSQHASTLAENVERLSREGSEAVANMVQAIDEINQASNETSEIIKTIDEIAFQTNLLALNAAVEAARAGDAGRGFAVVAEEVRNLAQRSALAARDTTAKIKKSRELAEKGSHVSRNVETALSEIRDSAGRSSTLVKEISAASNEQSKGVDEVNLAVTQLDQVTQSNAAAAQESAAAAEELLSQSRTIQSIVDQLSGIIFGNKELADKLPTLDSSRSSKLKPTNKINSSQRNIETVKAAKSYSNLANKNNEAEKLIPLDDGDFGGF